MSQNISLWGASYSNVPSVTLPKAGGGTASFTDVTDTTATASDVASGKYFYTAAGTKTQGTGTSGGYITQDANGYVVLSSTNGVPTLISKTITQNGTYNASSDNVTGYSSVSVNISSGMNIATNCAANTYGTSLTVYNVQNSPNAFVLVYDHSTISKSINSGCILFCSYDGTTTTAYRCSSGTLYALGYALTWSYNGNSHTLTFNSDQGFNDSNNNSGYTLYYT